MPCGSPNPGRLRLSALPSLAGVGLLWLVAACEGPVPSGPPSAGEAAQEIECSIPEEYLHDSGAVRDEIPSLEDPPIRPAGHPELDFIEPDHRVVGLLTEEGPLAISHRTLKVHEVVNAEIDGQPVAVTYCPLTGSSLTFDRGAVEGAELGVSGLLYLGNLVLFDRREIETSSLWPQMARQAGCGPKDGVDFDMLPSFEMTWAHWKDLHPETRAVSGETDIPLGHYVRVHDGYLTYEEVETLPSQFPADKAINDDRFVKERLLGIPGVEGEAIAFPFGELARLGSVAVATAEAKGGPAVVFWNEEAGGAAAFRPELEGEHLEFEVEGGRIVDRNTGSAWDLSGRARSGPREGDRLPPVRQAHPAFWFAWMAFHPQSRVWTAPDADAT